LAVFKRIFGSLIVIIYAGLLLFSPKHVYDALVYLLGFLCVREIFEDSEEKIMAEFSYSIIFISCLFFKEPIKLIFPMSVVLVFFIKFLVRKNVFSVFAELLMFSIVSAGICSLLLIPKKLLVLLIATVWTVDTTAYTVGTLIGKRKLFPEASPNKTVEGSLAGTVLGSIVCVFAGKCLGINVSFPTALSFSIISQVGDLIESLFKRVKNLKDTGSLIPGHGGVLDRIDSLLLLAPFVLFAFGG